MQQEKIWSYFQNEGSSAFNNSRGRLHFLAQEIAKNTIDKPRVLNIGVGNGLFEKIAISLGFDIYSLDPDERAIARLVEDLSLNNKAKVGYAQQIPFEDEFFDFVVVSEVLEHLSDQIFQKSLLEFHRILKKQGILLGTVPAREKLEEQIIICPKCGEKFHRWGHLQSFDKDRLTKLLGQKFQIQKISETVFVTWQALNWKGKLAAALKIMLHQLGSKGSGNSFYFMVKKDELHQ